MQVRVGPPHRILNGDVQFPEVVARGDFDAAPHRWRDVTQRHAKTQDVWFGRLGHFDSSSYQWMITMTI